MELPREDHGCAPAERRRASRYAVRVLLAGAFYGVLIVVSDDMIDRLAGIAHIADALVPLVGFLTMLFTIFRFVRELDGFQQRTILMTTAAAAVG